MLRAAILVGIEPLARAGDAADELLDERTPLIDQLLTNDEHAGDEPRPQLPGLVQHAPEPVELGLRRVWLPDDVGVDRSRGERRRVLGGRKLLEHDLPLLHAESLHRAVHQDVLVAEPARNRDRLPAQPVEVPDRAVHAHDDRAAVAVPKVDDLHGHLVRRERHGQRGDHERRVDPAPDERLLHRGEVRELLGLEHGPLTAVLRDPARDGTREVAGHGKKADREVLARLAGGGRCRGRHTRNVLARSVEMGVGGEEPEKQSGRDDENPSLHGPRRTVDRSMEGGPGTDKGCATISTRRFSCRAASGSLLATGFVSP